MWRVGQGFINQSLLSPLCVGVVWSCAPNALELMIPGVGVSYNRWRAFDTASSQATLFHTHQG